MRVLVAPDSFGDSMTATEAATAVTDGWLEVRPDDELEAVPLSDGGPGLLSALEATLPDAVMVAVDASGPDGEPLQASVLHAGATAYIESALACGLRLLRESGGSIRTATTYGVGQLLAAAAALDGVDTVVIGLGGSGTNDGGAGLWAGLGGEPVDALRQGGIALADLDRVTPPTTLGVTVVVATDVDNPLLGLHGATAVYGPQKGADRGDVLALDAALAHWADVVEAATGRAGLRDLPGAGAAGGLGFGLLALGAERRSGIDLVIELVGLRERLADVDLVVTGEGCYDSQSLRGKAVSGVARLASEAGVPCVVAAGSVEVGRREAAAAGVEETWSIADRFGSRGAAIEAGADGLRAVARDIAGAWSRGHST